LTETEAEVARFFAGRAERTVETACARVFLAADTAWKVKRNVDLGYVDFSTAERRLWALERELAFNKPAAPDIYRALHRLTRSGDGLELDGSGETVEYALEMRRFDDQAVLAAHPDRIDGDLAELLGRTIAGFHTAAPLKPGGGLSALSWTVGSNAEILRDLAPRLGPDRVETLLALTEAELERQAPLLAHRAAAGFARHCHGDLHLGNILVERGRPVLFDCIEFNDLLSDLDVLYDVAFLLMDLDFRGRRDAGVRVLSAYLDEAARSFPEEMWQGLAVLPLTLSVRAGVRAHVLAHSADDETARAYVEAGIAHLAPAPALLVAVGGLSGSGKSTFARAAAPGLGASPGAVILRTDEVRKRILGLSPTDAAAKDAYSPASQQRVYEVMLGNARDLLRAGRAVVLDATFMDPVSRHAAEQLASQCGVPFDGIWLEAPAEVLESRVGARRGDASDADVSVLRDQLGRLDVSQIDWRRVDASGDLSRAAAHAF